MHLRTLTGALEKAAIIQALIESHGNIQAAAKELGISRARVYELVQRYAIDVAEIRRSGHLAYPLHQWPLTLGGQPCPK